jgi:hypothetical protein
MISPLLRKYEDVHNIIAFGLSFDPVVDPRGEEGGQGIPGV